MKAGTSRNIYELIYWATVAGLGYLNRGLYDSVKISIEPMAQAYTEVALFVIGLFLFIFLNFLKEAIAATWTAFSQRVSSGGSNNIDSSSISRNLHKSARKMENKGQFLAAGETYESLEAWADAARAFEKGHAWNRAAAVHEKNNDLAKALEFYEKDGAFVQAALIAQKMGSVDRSRKFYRMAAEESLGSNQALVAAELFEKSGDFNKSAELYLNSRRDDFALRAYERAGNVEKVFQLVQSILSNETRLSHDSREVYIRCADILANNGHSNEAGGLMELLGDNVRAAEIYEQGKLWIKASELYLKNDNSDKAELAYSKVSAEEQDNEFFAKIATARGDLQKAGEYYEKAGKLNQAIDSYKRVKNYDAAANLYIQMGRFIMAGEMYSTSRNFRQAADCYAKAYDWRNAAECYEAIDEFSLAMEAYASSGNYYKAGKHAYNLMQYDKAIGFFQQVQQSSQDYFEALSLLSTIYFHQNRNDLAYELFQESISKIRFHKDNLHIFYAYAGTLEDLNPNEAVSIYKRIIGIDPNYSNAAEKLVKLEEVLLNKKDFSVNTASSMASNGFNSEPKSPLQNPSHSAVGSTTLSNQSTFISSSSYPTQSTAASIINDTSIGTYIDEENRYYLTEELLRIGPFHYFKAKDSLHNRYVYVQVFKVDEIGLSLAEVTAQLKMISSLPSGFYNLDTLATGVHEGNGYIINECPSGVSLYNEIRSNGPMSLEEMKVAVRAIGNGIDFLHRYGLTYGILSPHTIFVENKKDYKIMGVGLNFISPASGHTISDVLWENYPVEYMAPEQLLGTANGTEIDIYNLGLTLFYIAIGRTPFDIKRLSDKREIVKYQIHNALPRPSSVRAMLPNQIDEIFVKCTQKSPKARYNSVIEVANDLDFVKIDN